VPAVSKSVITVRAHNYRVAVGGEELFECSKLHVSKISLFKTKDYRPTQPPTVRRTGNEYLPKFGDSLRLGV